jgi:hypothetical protein
MRTVTVPSSARPSFVAGARARRDAARAQQVHYWVFVDTARGDAFTEFVEAGDGARLADVLRVPEGATESAASPHFTQWIEFALDEEP